MQETTWYKLLVVNVPTCASHSQHLLCQCGSLLVTLWAVMSTKSTHKHKEAGRCNMQNGKSGRKRESCTEGKGDQIDGRRETTAAGEHWPQLLFCAAAAAAPNTYSEPHLLSDRTAPYTVWQSTNWAFRLLEYHTVCLIIRVERIVWLSTQVTPSNMKDFSLSAWRMYSNTSVDFIMFCYKTKCYDNRGFSSRAQHADLLS